MTLSQRLKDLAKSLKQELEVYRLVLKDKRTPWLARILLGSAVGYALMPFDLIPDFIPLIGHLDDLIIVPGLVFLALKLIPEAVVADARNRVALLSDSIKPEKPVNASSSSE